MQDRWYDLEAHNQLVLCVCVRERERERKKERKKESVVQYSSHLCPNSLPHTIVSVSKSHVSNGLDGKQRNGL